MTSKTFDLTVNSMDVLPTKDGVCLLYNQCDGYHLAETRMSEDGSFDGFYCWMGVFPYPPELFAGWALLPSSVEDLYPIFADPRPFGECT